MTESKYVVVSKADVIKAIKTESLKPGEWFQIRHDIDNTKICHVCAVGAVIRSVLDESEVKNLLNSNEYYKLNNFVANELDSGEHSRLVSDKFYLESKETVDDIVNMAAIELKNLNGSYDELRVLSGLFESLCSMRENENYDKRGWWENKSLSRHQVYRIKQILIKFVEENFPSKIRVPVNGYSVRPGLKKRS